MITSDDVNNATLPQAPSTTMSFKNDMYRDSSAPSVTSFEQSMSITEDVPSMLLRSAPSTPMVFYIEDFQHRIIGSPTQTFT